jgi:proteasome accessory factor C
MSESALDRTARALDLVPYLLEHQGISTTELAEVFGTTEKQINEDLVLIHMCGLPGYTPLELIEMFYEDGYVTVYDPQSLKKPRKITRNEMVSILVSLDLMKSLRSDEIRNEIDILQRKLRASLQVENPFVVIQDAKTTPFVQQLEEAMTKSTPVRISYLSGNKDERTEREVIPLELYLANKLIYLNAWCKKSQAERTFRLDRITSCENIEMNNLVDARSTLQQEIHATRIRLAISKEARNFVEDNQSIIAKSEPVSDDEIIIVELNPIDSQWLVRTIMGYGGQIKVLEPSDLASEVLLRTKAIVASYGGK